MNTPSLDAIRKALESIQLPSLPQGLLSLQRMKDFKIDGGSIRLKVSLPVSASSAAPVVERAIREALMKVSGVQNVSVGIEKEGGGASPSGIPGIRQVIAVSSGKGGVGKSTIAVNLALALHQEGKRIGLMDADIYGPNLPTMMGVVDEPKIQEDPEKGEFFIPPQAHGIKVMSMGFLTRGDQPMIWRGPMLHNVVQQFCHRVLWGELDYLVIDMPPGTGDVQLSLAQLVPLTGAVMVTTPQEISMQDVRKAFHMWEKVHVPVLGIVENMSAFVCDGCGKEHSLFGSGGGLRLAEKYGVSLLGKIPLVQPIREGADEGRPIVMRAPESDSAQAFRAIAHQLLEQLHQSEKISSPEIQIGRF